jgi:glycopeptide antibiotics resistance protein
LIRRFAPECFILGLLLILALTLSPFNFLVKDGFSLLTIRERFGESSTLSIGELIANVFLFLPLGFGCTGLVSQKPRSTTKIWLITLIISASLSLLVEGLQIFLASRTPAITDLITNTVGGGLGGVIYLSSFKIDHYCTKLARSLKPLFSWRSFVIGMAIYVTFLFFGGFALQRLTSLETWSPAFPLMLGNEQTGDRPWQGYISQLAIADRAISKEEANQVLAAPPSLSSLKASLVAAYQFVGNGAYLDQSHQLSPLTWRGKQPFLVSPESTQGVLLGSNRWLETATPATPLIRRLQRTSQFTIDIILTPTKLFQFGPARILSLSKGLYQRNLMLGQEGNALVLRMRTSLTGRQGTEPELRISNFFTDLQSKHLLITYNGLSVKFYTTPTQPPYSLELNLGIPISRLLLVQSTEWSANLRDKNHKMLYKALYYGLIFIPLGFAWALISFRNAHFRNSKRNLNYLFIFYFFFLTILLEITFSGGRGNRLENQIYAFSMLILSAFVTRLWLQCRWEHPRFASSISTQSLH